MTKIQWTDETWNPVTGCTKVSEGCRHCYAETVSKRTFAGQTVGDGAAEERPRPRRFTDVRCHEDRLDKPLHWRKRRMVFVNSMSDLFHEDVPDEFVERVFAVMALAKAHTFQVLTKRPERMRDFVSAFRPRAPLWQTATDSGPFECFPGVDDVERERRPWPLPNVWLGVSCENQETADARIPLLRYTPAAVRFVSAEPLLGPIALPGLPYVPDPDGTSQLDDDPGSEPGPWLDWIIVGGESGSKARPCDVAWIRSIVAQCREAGVACFVKQLGDNVIANEMHPRCEIRARKGGDPAEWPEDLRVREWPEVPRDA